MNINDTLNYVAINKNDKHHILAFEQFKKRDELNV